jgi:tripartite-type tricarboxylate transporter receptor subunit TctC
MGARRRFVLFGLASAVWLVTAGFDVTPAPAQEFPSRPVKIMVGFPPGGSSDVSARIVAERMSEEWKQPVVVDNRPGAGTTLAAALVAVAPADGYTLLLISPGTHGTSSALYKNLPYDGVKSFSGIGLIATAPFVVVVPASSPLQTMKDLIDRAKANPEQVTYSTGGAGTGPHLVTEVIAMSTGIKLLHVPFRGSAPATTALLAEQVEFSMADASASSYIESGKMRGLAVTTASQSSLFRGIPTVAETVVPGFAYALSVGLAAPAGTPSEVISKINATLNRALSNEDTRRRLNGVGFEAARDTPEEFNALLVSEARKYSKIVNDIGLKLD